MVDKKQQLEDEEISPLVDAGGDEPESSGELVETNLLRGETLNKTFQARHPQHTEFKRISK